MNPHATPGPDGGAYGGTPPQGPPGPPPQGPYDSQPSRPPGRYGAGLLAVLGVIAVLGGASFLGGGLVLGGSVTSSIATNLEDEPTEEPTEDPTEQPTPEHTEEPPPTDEPTEDPLPTDEPTEEPTVDPEDLLTADELVAELRQDFDIDSRTDTTDEYCSEEEGEDFENPFQCSSSVDTNMVRAIAFEDAGIAMLAAMALQEDEEGDAEEVQDACHFVLIWFEYDESSQDERDEMTSATEEIVGCE